MQDDELSLDEELFETGDQVDWNDELGHKALIENCRQKYGRGPFQVTKARTVDMPYLLHSQYVWILIENERHKFSGALLTHTP